MSSQGLSFPNRKELEKVYESQLIQFEGILYNLQQLLRVDIRHVLLNPTIKIRVKSFDSYYKKILRKLNNPESRDRAFAINDLLGLRIVCPFIENLTTIESIIRGKYELVDEKRKGIHHTFKEFGYDSIHMIVKVPSKVLARYRISEDIVCEVQLRTILQDAWAEVEHELVYKANFSPFDESLKRKLAALNANLSLSDILFQEIRDYQRHLHYEMEKRRRNFINQIQAASNDMTFSTMDDIGFEGKEDANRITINEYRTIHYFNSDDNVEDLLLKALEAHNSDKYSMAIDIYTRILKNKPQENIQSVVYIHRGMAHFSESNYHQSLDDFSKALLLNKNNSKALYYRGIIHRVLQNYSAALEDLNRCLKLDPYRFDPLFNRAQIYYHLGDYPKSLVDCEYALNIAPNSKQVLNFRELVKSKVGM